MSSGKKNYFRHSFHARNDAKIAGLISTHGKEAYFHFFALVEVCAEIATDIFPDDGWFHFHPRTLASNLLVKKWTLISHLSAIHQSGLCDLSVEPQRAISDRTVEPQRVSVRMPNLSKFIGRYETNSPNKRKEKERKGKEIKLNADGENLSEEDFQETPKRPSPLSFLFGQSPEIQGWLNAGIHETHMMLLQKFSHHELADMVEKAYIWAKPRDIRAETWLYTFVSNKKIGPYGAGNGPNSSKTVEGYTTLATHDNPTGNPYLKQAKDKGLIA